MSNALALVELVLVFALVLGAGVWELRKVRHDARAAERAAPHADTPIADRPPTAGTVAGANSAEGAGSKRRRRR